MPLTDSSAPSSRARWVALVVVCLGQLMNIVDASIVNVALPSIQRDLHFSQSNLTWVINAYLISYGSLLLLAGRLGDLIGRRRIFLVGVSIFTAASALCGLAPTQSTLVVARFLQGCGGAAATSAIVAIIATEFPEPRDRAQAMSVYTFVISGGASLGLVAGGVITQTLDWHWIFFINVPIGILTVLLGRRRIVENPGLGIGRDVDWIGAATITVAMVVAVYGVVSTTTHAWGSAHTIVLLAVALALVAAFVALEARLRKPIMPLRIFAVPGLAASSLIRGLLITGMYSTFFLGVLYLERIRGYGVLQTGLAFLPQTIVLAALSSGPTAALLRRFGPRPTLVAGLLSATAGLVVLAQAGAHAHYLPLMCAAFVLVGLGAGLAFMPLLTIAMADVPAADAGLASGIINASLQLSAAFGVALLGTIATDHTRSLLGGGTSPGAALLGGYHLAFAVGAGCVTVAVLAALVLRLGGPPRRRERAVAVAGGARAA